MYPQKTSEIALRSGQFEGEGWRYRKDGSRFWAHVMIDTIRDEQNTLLGFAKITRDISEQKAINDRIASDGALRCVNRFTQSGGVF